MSTYYPEYIEVSLNSIDHGDGSLRLRPASDPDLDQELIEDIREIGLLHPPLLQHHKGSHPYTLLSGRKRTLAVSQLGWKTVPCLLLQKTTPALLKWKITLKHALTGSQLSYIEQALFFHKAGQELEHDELLCLLPILGHPANDRVLETFARALSLSTAARDGLHTGLLQEKHIDLLAKFATEDQEAIIRIIREYQLGGSKQRKLLLSLLDLRKRRNIPVESIMQAWLQTRKTEQRENKPQQAAELFTWLSEQLSPRLHGAEQDFRSFVREMQLPASCSLLPTPYFEDEELSLTMRFSDQECFRRQWQAIRQVLENSRE